jgi:Domain of unknown function (DUF4389)
MSPDSVIFDVTYTETRRRLTSAFRYILALPHLIFAALWGYAAEILAFLQWFVIVFTGRRNEGMWSFQRAYLGYNVRVSSYAGLLYDEYPNFGSNWKDEPVAFGLGYRPEANRLTNGLRLIWMIPALIISFFLGIAVFFILLVSWVVIIITGRHPRGMWDFVLRVHRFSFKLSAYGMLMTDEYPRYEGSAPTGMLPPGDRSTPDSISPPPPSAPLPPPSGPPAG